MLHQSHWAWLQPSSWGSQQQPRRLVRGGAADVYHDGRVMGYIAEETVSLIQKLAGKKAAAFVDAASSQDSRVAYLATVTVALAKLTKPTKTKWYDADWHAQKWAVPSILEG